MIRYAYATLPKFIIRHLDGTPCNNGQCTNRFHKIIRVR